MLFRCCYKVDCCVIAIILLRKAEGELIVNEKSIVTRSFKWISLISVFYFAQLTLISFDSLGGAETLPCVGVADGGVAIALARLACSSISRITVVARDTGFTVFASCQIFTLLTDAFIYALTVPIALTSWTLDEGPVIIMLFKTHADIKDRLQALFSRCRWGWHLDRTSVGAVSAFPLAGVAGIRAPPTARLLQAVRARAVA